MTGTPAVCCDDAPDVSETPGDDVGALACLACGGGLGLGGLGGGGGAELLAACSVTGGVAVGWGCGWKLGGWVSAGLGGDPNPVGTWASAAGCLGKPDDVPWGEGNPDKLGIADGNPDEVCLVCVGTGCGLEPKPLGALCCAEAGGAGRVCEVEADRAGSPCSDGGVCNPGGFFCISAAKLEMPFASSCGLVRLAAGRCCDVWCGGAC